MTGWVLDNIEVTSVGIWREPVHRRVPRPQRSGFRWNRDLRSGSAAGMSRTTYPNSPLELSGRLGLHAAHQLLTQPWGPLGNGTYQPHRHRGQTKPVIRWTWESAPSPWTMCMPPNRLAPSTLPTRVVLLSGSTFVNFGWALTQNPVPPILLDGVHYHGTGGRSNAGPSDVQPVSGRHCHLLSGSGPIATGRWASSIWTPPRWPTACIISRGW